MSGIIVLTTNETPDVSFLRNPGHRVLRREIGDVEQTGQQVILVACEFEVFPEAKDSSVGDSALVNILSRQHNVEVWS